jgi:phage shock protein C
MVRVETGLRRSRTDEVFAGVLGGVAEYFRLDAGKVRIAYVIASLFSAGLGIVTYLLAWYVIPEDARY